MTLSDALHIAFEIIKAVWIFGITLFALNVAWYFATGFIRGVQSMTRKTILIGTDGLQGAALARDAALYAENFRNERIMQYNKDRSEALRNLRPDDWKEFCLRWNLAPPYPKGWGDQDSQYAVMHKTRLMLNEFSEQERIFSAAWLVGHSFELPHGLEYKDGKLTGEAIQPGPPPQQKPPILRG
jgi:hypothetical protein